MSEQHYIALSVNPWGVSGCLATRSGKSTIEIQKTAHHDWKNGSAHNLTAEADTLQACMNNLRKGVSGRISGLVSIHPSWALVRRLPVPGGNAHSQQQYLTLQVERQQNILRNTTLLWDNISMGQREGADSPETLLVMCRAETLNPVEEAFNSCGIRPMRATIAPLADLAWAYGRNQLSGVSDCALLKAEANGADILEITGGVVSQFGWMPYGVGNNGNSMSQLALFSAKLEQRMSKNGIAHLAVCGSPNDRAPLVRHINFLPSMEEIDTRDLPSGLTFRKGLEKADEGNTSIEVLGLLTEQLKTSPTRINLLQQNATELPPWAERFSFLFNKKTAIPIAVVLATLLVGSLLKGGNIAESQYKELLQDAPQTAKDLSAARFNKSVLAQYDKEKISTLEVLGKVTELLPKGLYVTRLGIDKNGAIMITGKCKTHAQAEEIVTILNKSSMFSDAKTDRTSMIKEGQVNYSIRCQLAKWPGKKAARGKR